MLVEFSVCNYGSFAERQTFSMTASTPRGQSADEVPHHLFATGSSAVPYVLKTACIFGPNGVGKSTLLRAANFFSKFVINSSKATQEGEPIDVAPFAFDPDMRNKPSEFEAVFVVDDTLFQYGFKLDKRRVHEEWLFQRSMKPRSQMRAVFHRSFDESSGSDKYDWNENILKGNREAWREATRDNALFLSTAIQLKSASLKNAFYGAVTSLFFSFDPSRFNSHVTLSRMFEESGKEAVVDFVTSVCGDIEDINATEIDDDPSTTRSEPFGSDEKTRTARIRSVYKDRTGQLVEIDFNDESDGTKLLFNLAGPVLDAMRLGLTILVDEMHKSLHPHALRHIVSMFMNPEINKNGAQLIFTSHETSVMAKNFLHRDQIWLMEKSEKSSVLYPLSDYRVRDYEAFQRAYLDGRYGAIPKIRSLKND